MDLETKKLNSNIWKIKLLEVLRGVFFAIPIIVLFLQANGLSLTQIMVLQSIYSIISVMLEIPSGYFADLHGRRNTLIIATVSGLIAIIGFSLGHTFVHFLIAEIFFALSLSFSSGTLSALVYDTLKDLNKEDQYKKTWGSIKFYGMVALAVSGILGGLMAGIDLRYTLYASIPFFAAMIPLTLSLNEPKRHKIIVKSGYLIKLFKILKDALVNNKKLRWIIIYSAIIFAFNQSTLWLYQPYFKISGLDVVYFGIVFASFQLIAAFSSKYAYIIEMKLGQKYSLGMLIFLLGGSFLFMGNFVFLFSFSFAFIQQFVRGFRAVVVSDFINRYTESSVRATILSAESFISRLAYAMVLPIIGWVADVYSIQQALIIMGLSTLAIGYVMLAVLKSDKAKAT